MEGRGSNSRFKQIRATREAVQRNRELRGDLTRGPEKSKTASAGSPAIEVVDQRNQWALTDEDLAEAERLTENGYQGFNEKPRVAA